MAWTQKQRDERTKQVTMEIYVALIGSFHTTGSGSIHGPVTYEDAHRHAVEFVAAEEKKYP